MTNQIQVVTHSGIFHADEVFACALLNIAYGQDNVSIIRTRDAEVLDLATSEEDTWVVDVGGEFNPSMLNFDHHMRDFNVPNRHGNKLSSFGMVVEALLRRSFFSEVRQQLLDFSNRVDLMDNGVKKAEGLSFISVYNSYSETEHFSFHIALQTAISYLRSLINQWKEGSTINERLEKAIQIRRNGIVASEEYIPVDERLNALEDVRLVVYKSKAGTFNIQSVNVGETKDFSVRCPSPEGWRGLRDNDLIRASGGLPLTFCHVGGFLTVTSTDEVEEALRVASIIINTPYHTSGME